MKIVLFSLFFICIISCTSSANEENLEVYREKVLRYLVKERIQKDIHSIEFKRKTFFPGWHLAMFQGDNVDRSIADFKLTDNNKQISCGLYIREETETNLAVNLIECKGPHADELSGATEYGLKGLTVSKEQLNNF